MPSFKEAYGFDDFVKLYENVDCDTIDLKEVKAKTDYCYEAKVVYKEKAELHESGEEVPYIEKTYLLFPSEYNNELVYISPNGFLYAFTDETMEEDGNKTR